MIEINEIKSPFIYYCQKVIPLAFDESLSYYEMLCHLTAKIKEVIDEQNVEGQAIEELQQKYLLLVDYVDNYFDNLDVQEEINNKLDEMALDGTLENLIGQYIQLATTYVYNNVNEMINAENLVNGSFARTSGFYTYNDNGGAIYKIRTVTNEDVINNMTLFALVNDNTLVAEIIPSDKLNIKQLGAYGDNVHDDTTVLQYGVTYCENNNYSLYMPSGNYKITTEINVIGCCIEGNFKNTTLSLYNCDGLHLNPYLSQKVCEIKGLSFYTNDNTNYLEMCGIDIIKSSDTNRSRGYNIHECYFENLGCAIEVNDSFRTTIKDININNCFRALFIKNQTVQSYFNNIISNYDQPDGLTSTRYGNSPIGIQIGVSGATQRCEGIKIDACCMTNHEVGLYLHDGLFVNILGCEFDLCRKEGMIIYGHEGNCNIKNNWIQSKSATDESIVDIKTPNTSKYRLTIEGNLIGCSQGHADKIGISVGRTNYFKECVNIIGNTIKNFNNATPLKYGIFVDRCRNCAIINNTCFGCTTADIFFAPDRKGMLNNNVVDTLQFTIYSGSTMYGYSNLYTTVNKAIAGTYIGDIS